MPTRQWEVSREQSLADITAGAAGNGNDDHCPNGKSSYNTSMINRTLLRFTHDTSGMTKVTKVELFMRKTGGVHTAQGSGARAQVQRCGPSGSWASGGGGENSWSTSASGEKWPGPAYGTATYGSMTGSGWQSVNITDSYMPMIPASLGGGGETNNGIRVSADNETTVSDSFEFYGMSSSSYAPYLLVTYETNTAPNKPVNTSPANGAVLLPGAALAFSWTGSDPDSGDTMSDCGFQIATDAGFTAIVYSATIDPTPYKSGFNVTNFPYGGAALPTGVTLYWHVRNRDQDAANSLYSNPTTFLLGATPTVSNQVPSGTLADIWNLDTDGFIWTAATARANPILQFKYNHPGSRPMAAYRLRMWTDASVLVAGQDVTVTETADPGDTVTVNAPWGVVNGTAMRWTVEVKDIDGNWSADMAKTQFKVRWGQAIYYHNVGAGATGLQHTAAQPAVGRSGYMFRTADTADGSGTAPSAWVNDIAAVDPVRAYIHVMARLAAVVAGQNPAVADMTLTYGGASASVPDKWKVTSGGTYALDPSIRRYGRYGVRLRANAAAACYIYPWRIAPTFDDGVVVQQDTDYTFSAFVNTNKVAIAGTIQLEIYTNAGGSLTPSPWYAQDPETVRFTSDTRGWPEGWQRLQGSFHVPSGITALRPAIRLTAPAAGTTVWIDAAKLEPGRVASTWTPGFMADAGALDAQGLFIDGSKGGIFRLRGTADPILNPRATVEMGAQGLKYGGDTEFSSPSTGVMAINGVPIDKPTVVGASTRVAGAAVASPVNNSVTYPHGTPVAGEDPYGFHQVANGRLKIPVGMGGLYLYDVWLTGTAPGGTASSVFAYSVAHLNGILPAVWTETMGRWDRFDSASDQGMHGQVLRQMVAGDELSVTAHARIVAGSGQRVAGWSIVRLGTGIA